MCGDIQGSITGVTHGRWWRVSRGDGGVYHGRRWRVSRRDGGVYHGGLAVWWHVLLVFVDTMIDTMIEVLRNGIVIIVYMLRNSSFDVT